MEIYTQFLIAKIIYSIIALVLISELSLVGTDVFGIH